MERVSAVSGIVPTFAVEICFTTSITSDPENTLVGKRQSDITAALEQRGKEQHKRIRDEFHRPSVGGEHKGQIVASVETGGTSGASDLLSGESKRIGECDWSENRPFGQRVSYL